MCVTRNRIFAERPSLVRRKLSVMLLLQVLTILLLLTITIINHAGGVFMDVHSLGIMFCFYSRFKNFLCQTSTDFSFPNSARLVFIFQSNADRLTKSTCRQPQLQHKVHRCKVSLSAAWFLQLGWRMDFTLFPSAACILVYLHPKCQQPCLTPGLTLFVSPNSIRFVSLVISWVDLHVGPPSIPQCPLPLCKNVSSFEWKIK